VNAARPATHGALSHESITGVTGRATVAICEYGAGNVRSVALAFQRLGARLTGDVESADLAVLPGVGSAAAAMRGLRARELDDALRARVEAGRPVLGICLGLQLALEETEEDGGVEGLGIVPGRAVRLREGRVPRIGWAQVKELGGAFYFAHSYAAETPCATATSEGIVAAAQQGSFTGVQFHPEKSGVAGARFLESLCLSLV
jgi:imidazole glycerol phosphate synthase glutamine amidotransferase subunit